MRIVQIIIICCLSIFILVFSGGCFSCHQIGPKNKIKEDIEGRWIGKWLCEQTGDSGKIRCHLMEREEGLYQARFDGNYWGFIPFWFTIQMDITEQDGVYHAQAEEDLGWLGGGSYAYEGTISKTDFQISYTSKRHKGTFVLERCE